MSSHFKKKSILFYLVAITSIIVFFIMIASIGENLKAPEKKPGFEKINPYSKDEHLRNKSIGNHQSDHEGAGHGSGDSGDDTDYGKTSSQQPINFKFWKD